MFQTTRRVEFRDTDAAGIVHFSAFFPMMESAEHEMLRSLHIAVLPRPEDGTLPLTWPRVSATCDYFSAARFEDVLDVEVTVSKIGLSSVQYAVRFVCGGRDVALGKLTAVCCRLAQHGKLEKAEIPDDIRQRLSQHLHG